MEKAIQKLSDWHDAEVIELNDLAHGIAQSESLESMVECRQAYQIQHMKVDTIWEAIEMVQKTK